MSLVLNVLFISFVLFWMSRFHDPFGKHWYGIAVSIKIIAGITLGFIYSEYLQSGDTLRYFQEGDEIADIANSSVNAYFERLLFNEFPAYKGEARTEFFAKILSILLIITNHNYWLTTIYLSILSFMGCWYLARTIAIIYPTFKWPALIGLMLVPSFVFWSSGMLKDGPSIACLFVLCVFIVNLYHRKAPSLVMCLFNAISLIVLIKLRFYLGAYVLVALGWILLEILIIHHIRLAPLKVVLRLLTIVILALSVSLIDYNLQLNHLPASIAGNYQDIAESSGSNHIYFDLDPTWKSIFLNSPKSLFYGLFGPLPGQGNLLHVVYWIENFLLIVLMLFSAYLLIRKKDRLPKINQLHLMIFGYILIMATLLPVAAPNFGTLMRYKAAFLPFLWILLTYLPIQYFVREKSG